MVDSEPLPTAEEIEEAFDRLRQAVIWQRTGDGTHGRPHLKATISETGTVTLYCRVGEGPWRKTAMPEHLRDAVQGMGVELALDAPISKVEAAILAVWGSRCGDFDAGCPVCQAWEEYDKLKGVINDGAR